jgi:hypothetical protein
MPKQSSRKSVTRTLRLSEEMDLMIQGEAERLGISPNALVNKVMLQYKDVLRFDDPGTVLTMSKETFTSLLNQLEIDDIEDVGFDFGYQRFIEHLLRRGMEINHDNIFWYIDQLGKYGGWFVYVRFMKKDSTILHLKHTFGLKWSHFLSSYVSSIIRGELGLNVQSVIMENDVHLTITK